MFIVLPLDPPRPQLRIREHRATLEGNPYQKGEQKLPYPERKKKVPDLVVHDSFGEALGDIRLEIPFADAIKVPSYAQFLLDILNRKK